MLELKWIPVTQKGDGGELFFECHCSSGPEEVSLFGVKGHISRVEPQPALWCFFICASYIDANLVLGNTGRAGKRGRMEERTTLTLCCLVQAYRLHLALLLDVVLAGHPRPFIQCCQ